MARRRTQKPTTGARPAGQPAAEKASKARRRPLSRGRLVAFSIVSLLLATVLTEAALRVAGLGGMPRFFKPVLTIENRTTICRADNSALWLYFGSRFQDGSRTVGSMVRERLTTPKQPDTLRVFVLGESTVKGFPYPPNLCAAAFLQQYLQAGITGKRVEVINTGITAIASYPLRAVAAEIVNYEPDLIVVYAGHNEYYGAFGVASAQGVGTRPWQMALTLAVRRTGIYQGLARFANWLPQGGEPEPGTGGTLMERMAASATVAPHDPVRERANESLRANLTAVVRTAASRKVPVVLCTLSSNLRDLRPVRSVDDPEDGKTTDIVALRKSVDGAPHSALARFRLGRALEASGDTTAALDAYRAARDLDAMPWRATSSQNEVIREIARDNLGVSLCETEPAFIAAAGGPPGWNHFMDHLHPSLEGQAVLARVIRDCIAENKVLPLSPSEPPSWDAAARRLGANPLVEVSGIERAVTLFNSPPLDGDTDAARYWRELYDKALTELSGPERRAAETYFSRKSAEATFGGLSFLAARETMADRNWAAAAAYFRSASLENTSFTPERSLAQYYELLCRRLAGPATPAWKRDTENALGEAILTEKGYATPPMPLRHSLAGLALLSGQSREATARARALDSDGETAKALADEAGLYRRATDAPTTASASPGTRSATQF